MESDGSHDLDIKLAELRSVLNRIRAPQSIEDNVTLRRNESDAGSASELPRSSKWWVPVGLAASIAVVVIGFGVLRSPAEPQITDTAFEPVSGLLIARTQIPVRVHSLSRGAELR